MHEFRYLMPLDAMERISRQTLCDNFDEILDRVDKEDTGFVILNDDGKDRYVLCPARWMQYCFDDDFGCIINSALRYAIRRHTYMPGVVVDFIRKYIQVLDTKTIDVAIKDINHELEHDAVDNPEMWVSLRNELSVQQAYLHEKATIQEKTKK